MTSLARQQTADRVYAHLTEVGPQTVEEVKTGLGLTKRETEDAIHLLMSRNRAEYDYPTRSPLAYVARPQP